MRGTIGLVLEIVALSLAWLVYRKGFGAGPGGVIPMLWGVTIASIGLIIGGVMGAASLVKGERNPIPAVIAILLPLGTLAMLIIGRMGPP